MAQYSNTLYVRVEDDLKRQLALAAEDTGRSQAQFVRDAIEDALAQYNEFVNKPAVRTVQRVQPAGEIL